MKEASCNVYNSDCPFIEALEALHLEATHPSGLKEVLFFYKRKCIIVHGKLRKENSTKFQSTQNEQEIVGMFSERVFLRKNTHIELKDSPKATSDHISLKTTHVALFFVTFTTFGKTTL